MKRKLFPLTATILLCLTLTACSSPLFTHLLGFLTKVTSQAPDSTATESTVSTEMVATEPLATQPAPTEPAPTQPPETQPVSTEPAPTQPPETQPVPTEPAPTQPPEAQPAPTEPSAAQLQQEVLALVNMERQNAGLTPLSYAYNAQGAADVRATEILSSFSHTRPNGSTCFTALDEQGVTYYAAGENIAYGYSTAQSVVAAWMDSPGHRANILSPNFTSLAVGVSGSHWVQLFLG